MTLARAEGLDRPSSSCNTSSTPKTSSGAIIVRSSFFSFSLANFFLVFLDNESALNIQAGRDLLYRHGVVVHNYISYLGQLLDPNDNNFHSGFRARVNAALARLQTVDGPQKMRILHDAYYAASEEEIRGYFAKVGLIGDEDPRVVVSRLVSDGSEKVSQRFVQFHKENLEQYLHHLNLRGIVPEDRPELIGPWWSVLRQWLPFP